MASFTNTTLDVRLDRVISQQIPLRGQYGDRERGRSRTRQSWFITLRSTCYRRRAFSRRRSSRLHRRHILQFSLGARWHPGQICKTVEAKRAGLVVDQNDWIVRSFDFWPLLLTLREF